MNFAIALIPLILYGSVSYASFVREGNRVLPELTSKNNYLTSQRDIASIESRALVRTSCDRYLTPYVHLRTEILKAIRVLTNIVDGAARSLVEPPDNYSVLRLMRRTFGRQFNEVIPSVTIRFASMARELGAAFEGRGRVSIRCDDPEQKCEGGSPELRQSMLLYFDTDRQFINVVGNWADLHVGVRALTVSSVTFSWEFPEPMTTLRRLVKARSGYYSTQ